MRKSDFPSSGDDICKPHYGCGYCTDYVFRFLGKRLGFGDAKNWPQNIDKTQVKEGDIAIFRSINHVAIVKKVNRDQSGKAVSVDVSEWNNGSIDPNMPYAKECIITTNFGRETFHDKVEIQRVDGFCRYR